MKRAPFFIVLLLCFNGLICGQNSKNVVQFSGLVVGGDSLYGIPGVLISIPKAGRGTMTNDAGFFSLPTLVGDSVMITALGYKKKTLSVPKSDRQSVTLIIGRHYFLSDCGNFPLSD